MKDLENKTKNELQTMIATRRKLVDDLSDYLSKHTASEPEFNAVLKDRQDVFKEIALLEAELVKKENSKDFLASLNEEKFGSNHHTTEL